MTMLMDDREGFAAFLLRLRALGIPPKDLVAAMEATPRKTFARAYGSRWRGRIVWCRSSAAKRWRGQTFRPR